MIAPTSTICIPPVAERAIAAARSVSTNRGYNQHDISQSDVTIDSAAKIHSVSSTSVDRALAVIECVSDEPLQLLESGQLNLSQAAALAVKLGRRKVSRQRSAATWQIIVL